MRNNDCNGAGPHVSGQVRIMATGGGGNDILCRSCWYRALAYRIERQQEHNRDKTGVRESLPAWETAKVYDTGD